MFRLSSNHCAEHHVQTCEVKKKKTHLNRLRLKSLQMFSSFYLFFFPPPFCLSLPSLAEKAVMHFKVFFGNVSWCFYKGKQCGVLFWRGSPLTVPPSLARYLQTHTHKHTPPLPGTLVCPRPPPPPPRILPFMCNFEYTVPPWKNTTLNSSHLSLAPPLIRARLIFTAASVLLPSRFRADGV